MARSRAVVVKSPIDNREMKVYFRDDGSLRILIPDSPPMAITAALLKTKRRDVIVLLEPRR